MVDSINQKQLTDIVQDVKIIKKDDQEQIIEVEIVTSSNAQRVLYEQYYSQLAKDYEVQGFRKGQAPRELVEPQIYKKVVDYMIQHLFSLALLEGIKQIKEKLGKEYMVLDEPEVLGVDFKMVETPIVFKLRFYVVPRPVLPDLTQFSLKGFKPQVEVTDNEVEDAIKQLFDEWKSKADKKTRSKFTEPTDEWVKELKIGHVSNLQELREHLKGVIEKQKSAHLLQHKLDEVMHSILHEFNVKIPDTLRQKLLQGQLKQLEEQLKQLGVTLEQYFKANNIDRKEYEDRLIHHALDSIKSRLFWEVFIEEHNIKIEDTPVDRRYVEYSAFAMASQGKQRLNSYELLTNAILVKAQDKLMHILEAPEDVFVVKPSEVDKLNTTQKDKVVSAAQRNDIKAVEEGSSAEESGGKSKILIPDDAKI